MKLNMHSITPTPPKDKRFAWALPVAILLLCLPLALGSFAILFYGDTSFSGRLLVTVLYLLFFSLLGTVCGFMLSDIKRAYVEIDGNNIHVTDYYFRIRKEKHLTFDEIASASYVPSSSFGLRGYRVKYGCYIVLKDKQNRYLFKVFACPETERVFEKYLGT